MILDFAVLVDGVPMDHLSATQRFTDSSKFKNAERPHYYCCCCWWAANRLCCGPGMRPVEPSAPPVALACVEHLWRVAFVCGPQLVGLQRT